MAVLIDTLPRLTATEMWSVFFAFLFMLLDVIYGIVCACVRHDFQSSKIREGLGHKAVLTLILVLALVVQTATGVLGDFGYHIPLVTPVCIALIVMEIGSCLETLADTYPDFKNSKLYTFFLKDDSNDER